MPKSVTEILCAFGEKNALGLSEKDLSDFEVLCDDLLAFNAHTNLTAIRDREGVAIKHFADSLSALLPTLPKEILPDGARVIDVGCGAGFPGLPLKLVRKDLDITFLDSTAKKLKFTEEACRTLGFSADIKPVRAEDLCGDKAYRERFDTAVSRAVAALPVLCEISLPFVKTGGYFAAYKATGSEEETESAKKAIPALGGKLVGIFETELPENAEGEILHHSIVLIRKVKPTPPQHPRRYAQIVKKPL